LLAFALCGLFVILLYTVPSFTPFGMDGIWIRSKWMTYIGDEMEYIFRQRNMIVESENTEIVIRIRKIGYEDEARVQVFEDANGISFNSTNRTQVDFLEVLDEDGAPYTKIIVREPQGILSRTARVYINLKRDPMILDINQPPYNFVLNTGHSPVRFEYDPSAEFMKIDTLVVRGTGKVTLPAPVQPTPELPNPFELRVGNLEIDSPNSAVTCLSTVYGLAKVRGGSRNITLGDIQSLDVDGDINRVYVNGNVNGNAFFDGVGGALRIGGVCNGNVRVRAQDVDLDVRDAIRLDIQSTAGHVKADKVRDSSKVVMESGSLILGSRDNGYGVWGNVDIEKKYGGASVIYANDIYANGELKIRAIDGEISAHGVRGYVDIVIASMGNANVRVGFFDIVDKILPGSSGSPSVLLNSRIIIEGSRQPDDYGKITVVFLDPNLGARLHIRGTSTVEDKITEGRETEPDNCTSHQHNGSLADWEYNSLCHLEPINDMGRPLSVLHLKTQTKIEIRAGIY
jgi:hypothetical protein